MRVADRNSVQCIYSLFSRGEIYNTLRGAYRRLTGAIIMQSENLSVMMRSGIPEGIDDRGFNDWSSLGP